MDATVDTRLRYVPPAQESRLARLFDNKAFLVTLCLLPTVGLLVVFLTYPLGLGVWLSFTDTTIGQRGEWIGLENFHSLADDPVFWNAVWYTIFYTAVATVGKFLLGLWLALLLNNHVPLKAFIRAIVLLPWIVPTVLSMSSVELEAGLDALALDLAFGYTERMGAGDKGQAARLQAWPQTVEHYFLLRRRSATGKAKGKGKGGESLHLAPPIGWAEAAALPLVLLTPEMHNRAIVDAAFATAGAGRVLPAIETNSVLTLALAVQDGEVCAILPGAMVDTVRRHADLEALPLVDPEVRTPLGFMAPAAVRPSRTLEAALALLQDEAWRAEVEAHSGTLRAD